MDTRKAARIHTLLCDSIFLLNNPQLQKQLLCECDPMDEILAHFTPLSRERVLRNLLKVNPMEILIFGSVGAGKSSFINRVCAALNPGVVCEMAPTSDAHKPCTKHFTRYNITSKIVIWDTFGLTKDNYSAEELQNIFSGMYYDDYSEFEMIAGELPENTPNAVVFVISTEKLDNILEVQRGQQIITLARKQGLPVLVVVSKVIDFHSTDAIVKKCTKLFDIAAGLVLPSNADVQGEDKLLQSLYRLRIECEWRMRS